MGRKSWQGADEDVEHVIADATFHQAPAAHRIIVVQVGLGWEVAAIATLGSKARQGGTHQCAAYALPSRLRFDPERSDTWAELRTSGNVGLNGRYCPDEAIVVQRDKREREVSGGQNVVKGRLQNVQRRPVWLPEGTPDAIGNDGPELRVLSQACNGKGAQPRDHARFCSASHTPPTIRITPETRLSMRTRATESR